MVLTELATMATAVAAVLALLAQLEFAEQLFRSTDHGGWKIAARIDRAYRIPSGQLVLVELKTRFLNRIYLSDVVELSAQRIAIETDELRQVSHRAFVMVKSARYPDGRFREVTLMPSDAVWALVARRERLLSGLANPGFSRSLGLCSSCAFRQECGRLPK